MAQQQARQGRARARVIPDEVVKDRQQQLCESGAASRESEHEYDERSERTLEERES